MYLVMESSQRRQPDVPLMLSLVLGGVGCVAGKLGLFLGLFLGFFAWPFSPVFYLAFVLGLSAWPLSLAFVLGFFPSSLPLALGHAYYSRNLPIPTFPWSACRVHLMSI